MRKLYIPQNITRKDILNAIEEIKRKGVPPKRKANKLLVESKGIYFPPKYVISLANKYANGKEYKSKYFYSGERVIEFFKDKRFKMVRYRPL